MRIISSFKDYYDCGQTYGQDLDCVYIREIREEIFNWSLPGGRNTDFSNNLINRIIIGFAGKIYLGVDFSIYLGEKIQSPRQFCYSIEDCDKFAEKHLKEKELQEYYTKNKYYWKPPFKHHLYGYHSYFSSYFNKVNDYQKTLEGIFSNFSCSIFKLGSSKWKRLDYRSYHNESKIIINPNLREQEFYRRLEPYTAYQELQMYVGNLAVPQKPIPVPTDKEMVEIKGFDPKWSFRKPPSK